MSSGCGCKEVYRSPLLLIPTPLVSALFCSSIPTFCSFLKCFSFLFQYTCVIYLILFSRSINKHTGDYRHYEFLIYAIYRRPTEAV